MKFLIKIYLILFGKKVGMDKYKNSYYEITSKYTKNSKRFVIYKGLNEGTKVPPEWECWLRYSTQKPIIMNKSTNPYSNYFLPNLTGTIYKYCYTRNLNTKRVNSQSSWLGNKYDSKQL